MSMLSPSSIWFITGATSGFGKRFTLTALSRGDRVIATGRSLDKLQSIVSSLKPEDAERVRIQQLDVTAGEEQVKSVVNQAAKHWGGIDVLINNAGVGYHGLMEEGGSKLLRRQFEANVFGVVDVSIAALPYLRQSSNGRLVVIGSRSAWKAERLGLGPYSASKAAVGAFTENLMTEVAPFNIKVLLVLPGAFRTEGIYGQRFFQDNSMPIHDEARTTVMRRIAAVSGNEPGDPDKGAEVLVDIVQGRGVAKDRPWPSYLCLGEDAETDVRYKCETVLKSLGQWSDISRSVKFY
ncbi:hypothetical protein CPB83DRAFT_849078 [Crepidotus variabilis]|uniref:NAD(P)-binding protein n=1 Tax=Crepidotus variabilis TaxID=179855 RepID=A0A9P6EMS9_9AGAR|nr:hypothetical protein CPB83DRAFT_849078 [Crepidotus variabilis]